MSAWAALEAEVARWQAADLRLPLWWRDDDAVAPTVQLERLTRAAEAAGMAVHLAVIPARATPELAVHIIENERFFRPVVHGWAHENHAPAPHKRSEFGTPRPDADRQAAQGLARLTDLFGAALAPVFVPPWNRIDPGLAARLPGLGYRVLSTFAPRRAAFAAPGLVQVNTHLDPVDWRGTGGLLPQDALVRTACAHLAARREGMADAGEPYGLLTHHLVHDAQIWDFCARFLGTLSRIAHPIENIANWSEHEPS